MLESKSAAQVAYETLIEKLKGTEGADSAAFAPPWDDVPDQVRVAIAEALDAADSAPALELPNSDGPFPQLAYRAYVKFTGGLNYQGKPCPAWPDLPEKIRGAWAAATLAVRNEHDSRLNVDLDWLDGSTEELAELVAALDALQAQGTHRQHVLVPLRTRLRAALEGAKAEPSEEVEPETAEPAPELPSAEPKSLPTSANLSAPTDAPKGEQAPPGASQPPKAPDPEPSAQALRAAAPELPKPSEAPPAPVLEVDLPGTPVAPAPNDGAPFDPSSAPVVVAGHDLGSGKPAAEFEGETTLHQAGRADAPVPDVRPETPDLPGSAEAPAVGVIPEGHVQTSEEAAHTQTPDTR
jgi:hypothetical protein